MAYPMGKLQKVTDLVEAPKHMGAKYGCQSIQVYWHTGLFNKRESIYPSKHLTSMSWGASKKNPEYTNKKRQNQYLVLKAT